MAWRWMNLVRGVEWWEYKLAPTLACLYSTALVLDRPLVSLWSGILILLAALTPGAIYVSVSNDIADREVDAAAGKANRMAGMNPWAMTGLVIVPVSLGVFFCALWWDSPWLVMTYLAAWLVFTLYSAPPFRLKQTGLPGVLADASGAHLFPALVAVLLVYRETGMEPDLYWLCASGAWAFGYGLRGILWHQLLDQENDRVAGVGTYVCRNSPEAAIRLAGYVALPLEIIGVSAMLWQMQEIIPVAGLAAYGVLVFVRVSFRGWPWPVLVQPQPKDKYMVLLQEYYDVILPVGILIAATLRNGSDCLILAAHLALFPVRAKMVAREMLAYLKIGVIRGLIEVKRRI